MSLIALSLFFFGMSAFAWHLADGLLVSAMRMDVVVNGLLVAASGWRHIAQSNAALAVFVALIAVAFAVKLLIIVRVKSKIGR